MKKEIEETYKEIASWLIVLFWITGMSLWLYYGGVVTTTKEKIVEKEVCKNSQVSTVTSIFFVDKNVVSHLPHCALNWDYSKDKPYNEDWCSDSFTNNEIIIKRVKRLTP